jgi:hypothetical protein
MLHILKFRTVEEAEFVLAGGLIGAEAANKTFAGLVGKAITFSNPVGSKTFTQPANKIPDMLTFPEIKAQLETITNLKVELIGGRIGFRDSGGASVTLAKLDQPARAILGLSNPLGGVAISGKKINPPGGASPYVVSFAPDNNTIYVMIEET